MSSINLRTAEMLDRFFGFITILHFYKPVSFAFSSLLVGDDPGRIHFSVLFKDFSKFFFVDGVIQVSNVNVHFSLRLVQKLWVKRNKPLSIVQLQLDWVYCW